MTRSQQKQAGRLQPTNKLGRVPVKRRVPSEAAEALRSLKSIHLRRLIRQVPKTHRRFIYGVLVNRKVACAS